MNEKSNVITLADYRKRATPAAQRYGGFNITEGPPMASRRVGLMKDRRAIEMPGDAVWKMVHFDGRLYAVSPDLGTFVLDETTFTWTEIKPICTA